MKKILKTVLPNLCIVLSVMILVFLCIDYFNPAMQFVDNEITKVLMFVLGVVAVAVAIMYIKCFYKSDKE